jgi:hypothetical protein
LTAEATAGFRKRHISCVLEAARSLLANRKSTMAQFMGAQADAKNGAVSQAAALNLQIGKAYITNANPEMAKRIWQTAMDEFSTHGKETSQKRCKRAFESKAFNLIRKKVIIETTAEDLMAVLRSGGAGGQRNDDLII